MFKEDVKRTIGKVLKDNGYKVCPLDKGCMYYIKRYSDKLAFYIRCSDSRHFDAGVTVEMFFTAIQLPDDRFLSFGAGLHIHILTVYSDITDEIMIAAGEKIVEIEKNIGNISNIILEEIKNPYFPSKRLQIFNEILLVYDTINEDPDLQEEFFALKSKIFKVAKKKNIVEAFQLCSEFVDKLSIEYFRDRGIDLEIDRIKDILVEQVRAQCMLGI